MTTETVILADLQHGVALWHGGREEQEGRLARMRRKAMRVGAVDVFDGHMLLLSSSELPSDELAYAVKHLRLARRTLIRLRMERGLPV